MPDLETLAPLDLTAQGVLLDIEGTTSSIQFVHEVMFPYARRHLEPFLAAHWDDREVQDAMEALARDAGFVSRADWLKEPNQEQARQKVSEFVQSLMARDAKATGLKMLQGLIWRGGFHTGELRAHLYDDVVPALKRWREAGLDVRIYSSGSVESQKLFFGHTIAGNLLPFFRGHFDTRMGGKKDCESYRRIAAEFGLAPAQIVFVSDVPDELVAAKETGMQCVMSVRPGNAPVTPPEGIPITVSFAQLKIRK